MHPYIPYLLKDIVAAERPWQEYKPGPEKTFEEEMEELENWIENGSEFTFSYHCGLDPENFPPASQLNDEDKEMVIAAMEQMMKTYNASINFPEGLPVDIRYELIIDTLNEFTDVPEDGMIDFEVCSCFPDDCKLKEYCTCRTEMEEANEEEANEVTWQDIMRTPLPGEENEFTKASTIMLGEETSQEIWDNFAKQRPDDDCDFDEYDEEGYDDLPF